MARAHGLDVSKWQGEMDWEIAGSKVDFAFIRAGSITSISAELYEDYQFIRNSGLAPQYVDYVDYYWYFRPKFRVLEQADYFSNLVDGAGGNLRLVADFEDDMDMTLNQVADANAIFCERIKTNTGNYPMVYTRATYWNSEVARRALWADLDLSIARYKAGIPYPYGNPTDQTYLTPRDWPDEVEDWDFWQYSADGNGKGHEYGAESASIDLQHFNGTITELAAYSANLHQGTYSNAVYVKRERNTILYDINDTYDYKAILHPGHKMVVDGVYVRESDGAEFYLVGDGLVRKEHCAPIT